MARQPTTTLVRQFSSDGATARPWSEGESLLANAEIYWISTVRADGRPHVTPLLAVLLDGALHFCTGAAEQKAKNIEHNARVVMTTGRNDLNEGLDVVVEGEAVRVTDDATLSRSADQYQSKYQWTFTARDGVLHSGDGGDALLFRVEASKALGFGKGEPYSQTRWRFSAAPDTNQ